MWKTVASLFESTQVSVYRYVYSMYVYMYSRQRYVEVHVHVCIGIAYVKIWKDMYIYIFRYMYRCMCRYLCRLCLGWRIGIDGFTGQRRAFDFGKWMRAACTMNASMRFSPWRLQPEHVPGCCFTSGTYWYLLTSCIWLLQGNKSNMLLFPGMNDDECAAFYADSSCWCNLPGEPLQDRERVNYWSATHQKLPES